MDAWRAFPNPGAVAGDPRDRAAPAALARTTISGIRAVLLPDRSRRDHHLDDRGRAEARKRESDFSNTSRGQRARPTRRFLRLALKLATGAGKTTVMAMLIAWQTINAVRHPESKRFTRGFLIVTPGITIKDRLRVLLPNDPDNYYATRELVPQDMLRDSAGRRSSSRTTTLSSCASGSSSQRAGARFCRGAAPELSTLETEGQMLQRVMPELMGLKNILVLNDEAHHCYREKRQGDDEGKLKGDEQKEAKKNIEAARLWIGGLETVNRKLGVRARHRSLGDAVLSERLRLCRRHALPLDDERLLAHGRDRVRHREAPAGPCGRQHSRR